MRAVPVRVTFSRADRKTTITITDRALSLMGPETWHKLALRALEEVTGG